MQAVKQSSIQGTENGEEEEEAEFGEEDLFHQQVEHGLTPSGASGTCPAVLPHDDTHSLGSVAPQTSATLQPGHLRPGWEDGLHPSVWA